MLLESTCFHQELWIRRFFFCHYVMWCSFPMRCALDESHIWTGLKRRSETLHALGVGIPRLWRVHARLPATDHAEANGEDVADPDAQGVDWIFALLRILSPTPKSGWGQTVLAAEHPAEVVARAEAAAASDVVEAVIGL